MMKKRGKLTLEDVRETAKTLKRMDDELPDDPPIDDGWLDFLEETFPVERKFKVKESVHA